MPRWSRRRATKWPGLQLKQAGDRIDSLMDVQSPFELTAVRAAAKTTTQALMAGLRAIGPGVSQRSVEAVIDQEKNEDKTREETRELTAA